MATGCTVSNRILSLWVRDFALSSLSASVLGPSDFLSNEKGSYFSGAKRLVRETDNLLPTIVEVKNTPLQIHSFVHLRGLVLSHTSTKTTLPMYRTLVTFPYMKHVQTSGCPPIGKTLHELVFRLVESNKCTHRPYRNKGMAPCVWLDYILRLFPGLVKKSNMFFSC
jgi:hypothetical protein